MSFSRIEMEMMNSIIDMARSMREIANNMGKIMNIKGKQLPHVSAYGQDANVLDVFRIDEGVGFVISEGDKAIAGCNITYAQWHEMVATVESQFGNHIIVEKDDGK